MKKILFSLFIFVFALSIVFPSLPKEATRAATIETNLITVTGEAKIQAEPDVAYINISVETANKNSAVAQAENAKNMTAVLETLNRQNILREQIKTTSFNVYPEYDYTNGRSVFKHYKVTNCINVKIYDLNKIGNVIDSISQNSITRINGIDFAIENQNEVYETALANALLNAKTKAAVLAGTAGLSDLKIVSIKENQTYQNSFITRDAVMYSKAAEVSTPIIAGNLTVSANVEVVFSF